MASMTVFLFLLIVGGAFTQFPPQGRPKNRRVQALYRRYCRGFTCPGMIEWACELNYNPEIRCFRAPCPQISPYCAGSWGSLNKPGSCPPMWRIRRYGFPECNTDWGCPGNQICCHGRFSTECRNP